MRKIAANYVFLPGFPLTKNGYVVFREGGKTEVVDTGGKMREIAGLEFYGGWIVPEYVIARQALLAPGEKLLPFLEQCFVEKGTDFKRVALIEGADLIQLTWRTEARIRLL